MERSSKESEKAAHGMKEAASSMADTVLAVMDKLAGKESDIRLSFEELTLDMGRMKATLNGAIVLDVVYAKEAEETGTSRRMRETSTVVTP